MDELLSHRKRPVIGVIGAGSCTSDIKDMAEKTGRLIAESGAVLVCGGLGGVMEATSKGAREVGGTTIGILPGNDKTSANRYIDYVIATGIGEARNILIIKTADAVIALPGKFGTLSEMAFAMKIGKPLVSLSNWDVSDEIFRTNNPEEAVREALKLAGEKN